MARPTKFTAPVRKKILEALQVGCSRPTAAHIAGVDESTLRTWLKAGAEAREGSGFATFRAAVLEAEAHPKTRALGIIYDAMADKPELAWKFLERREHGFAPQIAAAAAGQAPAVVVNLSLADGRPAALAATQIEVGTVESDEEPGTEADLHQLPNAGGPAT